MAASDASPFPIKNQAFRVTFPLFDNDGDLDVLLSGLHSSPVKYAPAFAITKIYRNDGDGVFTDIGAKLDGVANGGVSWGDYDDDGDLDILLTGATGGPGPDLPVGPGLLAAGARGAGAAQSRLTDAGQPALAPEPLLVVCSPYPCSTTRSSEVLHATIPARDGRPDAGWIVPLVVKFFTRGADVLNDSPVCEFKLTTAKSSYDDIAVCEATGIAPGTYDITVSGETTLMNVKRDVVISATNTSVDLGVLLEGDANQDGTIDLSDYGILSMCWQASPDRLREE